MEVGMIAEYVTHSGHQPAVGGFASYIGNFRGAACHRFLDKYVASAPEGAHGLPVVMPVGRGDDYGVDFIGAFGQHLFVGGVEP